MARNTKLLNAKAEESSDVSISEPQEPFYPTEAHIGEFILHRQHVWDLRKANLAGFENLLLTLSAATLAFSLTYLKDIVQDKTPIHPVLMIGSWAFLAVTIFATLASYLFGVKACERDIDIYQDYYYNGQEASKNVWSRRVEVTHWIAGGCFVIGVSFTIWFAAINLNYKPQHQLKSQSGEEIKKCQTKNRHKEIIQGKSLRVGMEQSLHHCHRVNLRSLRHQHLGSNDVCCLLVTYFAYENKRLEKVWKKYHAWRQLIHLKIN